MDSVAKRLAGLTPEQRRLLEQRLAQQQGGAPKPPAALRRDDAAPATFPLTSAQQIMWALARLFPGAPVCNDPITFRFRGPFAAEALDRALNEIWRRHEILRATFALADGQPQQTIAPLGPVPIRHMDLTHLPAPEREAEALRQMTAEARTGLDPARGPLLSLSLFRLAPDDHILLRTTHHLVSDGWSQGIFIREVLEGYEAFATGKPSPLDEPQVRYRDYARWEQQTLLTGPTLAGHLAYWRQHLAGATPAILPTDYPRPAQPTWHGAREVRFLPRVLINDLKAASQRLGVTLYTTMLTGLLTAIARRTRQTDLLIGTFGATRSQPEIESLIGWFVHTLLIRADLAGDPSLGEFVARVGRVVADNVYTHQDVPLDALASMVYPPDGGGRLPFTILLAFDLFPNLPHLRETDYTLAGAQVTHDGLDTNSTKCDLGLWILDRGAEGVELAAEHNADLFERRTMAALLAAYQHALETAVAAPERRLSTLWPASS